MYSLSRCGYTSDNENSETETDKKLKASHLFRKRGRRGFKELASCSSTESDCNSDYYDYVSDSTLFYCYGYKY